MKNLFKFLALSVLASFIALGCSNTSDDAVSNGLNITTAAKTATKTITLVATGDADAISFPTANHGISATIVADTIEATSLKYYLFYTNKVTNTPTNPTAPLTFTAASANTPNVGTVPLEINDGYYEFKLYATNEVIATPTEASVAAKALFLGQTEADLRTSADTVTFYLTSDTLTGSAAVALKLKTTGWTVPTGYTMTAAITKKTDGAVVPGPDWTTVSSITATEPTTAQYNQASVTAGTYNFEVRFFNSGSNKTYTWSDTIIVAPNHNIAKTIAIPEVIDLPPVAPTAFNAVFKDPDTVGSGYYNVEFDWAAAASINESFFQIELLEIPSGTAWASINADTSTEWTDDYRSTLGNTDAAYLTTLGSTFYGNESQNWVSGSLRKNNTTATVALPLGKRYLARIAAVNDAGPSAYCYVDFDNAVPATVTTGYAKFAAASKVINRYRLTYNLLGGTIKNTDNTESTADIVEYRTQNEVANGTASSYNAAAITSGVDVPTADIWNPSTDTTTYTSLKKGSKAWTSWKKDSSSSNALYDSTPASSPYNPPDYKDCLNLVLYANYSPTTASVNILDDNEWDITVANFTGTAPSGDGVTTTDLEAKSQITLNLATSGAGDIVWTGAYTTAQSNAGIQWSSVTYTIKKSGENYLREGPKACTVNNTGFAATTSMSTYTIGKYAVTFNAYAPHKTLPYTYTIYVDVVEE